MGHLVPISLLKIQGHSIFMYKWDSDPESGFMVPLSSPVARVMESTHHSL